MSNLTRRAAIAAGLTTPLLASHTRGATRTIEFTTWQSEEPGFGVWWHEVIAAFEHANPSVRIAMTQIPFKDYLDQLTIRFASNRPPPLVELPSDSIGFAAQGWLQPLEDRIRGTVIGTPEWSPLQQDIAWDGKPVGVLLMGYAFMMFYNQALLEGAGVALPTSWPEFCAAVPRITNRERGIFGLSAVTTEYPTIPLDLVRTIVWSGGALTNGHGYTLTSPKVLAAAELYRRVVGANAPLGANSTIIRQLFTDGKTGFLIDGPWVWALLDRAPAAVRPNLKMAKCPFSPPLGGASNSIHMAAGLDRATQDAAWSFIAFITTREWQQRYTVLSAAPAARLNVLGAELERARPELVAINQSVIGALSTVPDNQSLRTNYNEYNKILQVACVKLLSTTAPVMAVMKETQAQLEQAAPLT